MVLADASLLSVDMNREVRMSAPAMPRMDVAQVTQTFIAQFCLDFYLFEMSLSALRPHAGPVQQAQRTFNTTTYPFAIQAIVTMLGKDRDVWLIVSDQVGMTSEELEAILAAEPENMKAAQLVAEVLDADPEPERLNAVHAMVVSIWRMVVRLK
jgi:hypothetical protein